MDLFLCICTVAQWKMLPWVDIVTNKQVLLTRVCHHGCLIGAALRSFPCPNDQDSSSDTGTLQTGARPGFSPLLHSWSPLNSCSTVPHSLKGQRLSHCSFLQAVALFSPNPPHWTAPRCCMGCPATGGAAGSSCCVQPQWSCLYVKELPNNLPEQRGSNFLINNCRTHAHQVLPWYNVHKTAPEEEH